MQNDWPYQERCVSCATLVLALYNLLGERMPIMSALIKSSR